MSTPANSSRAGGLWSLVGIGFAALLFGAGTYAGRVATIYSLTVGSNGKSADIAKVINLYGASRSDTVSFDEFWEVWRKVKSSYVEQPVDDVKLFYGAIEGMVAGLDDPHSAYFPPKEAKEFADDLAGHLEGVGIEIGIRDDILTVIAPLAETPAARVGLLPGDKIFTIDGKETPGITIDEAVRKIRGPEGTRVTLGITRDGWKELKEFTMTRQKIAIPTVEVEVKPGNIAVIRIFYFNQETWAEVDKTIKRLLKAPPRGIVLDLRRNPGGYLDTAIRVASEWVADGLIVSEKGNGGLVREHASEGSHRLANIPTVVLVDRGTASGAEIVAGALQDYKLATIVGEKTYGKGSVQDFEALRDGSALKLTIARWHTPLGRQIDKEGIAPDMILEKMTEEKTSGEKTEVKDLGLEKALEILQKK